MATTRIDYAHLPARASRVTVEEITHRQTDPIRLNFGTPQLDNYLVPMMVGDLVSVLGRPGHGKTTLLLHLARHLSSLLKGTDRYVYYSTWETTVEEFCILYLSVFSGQTLEMVGRGTADLEAVKDAAIAKLLGENLIVVGRSMERGPKGRPRMVGMPTLTDSMAAIDQQIETGHQPGIFLWDYLQAIPSERGPAHDRSEAVSVNLARLKDFSMSRAAPSAVGVQAKREVDDYSGLRLAQLGDGQWTSNIEQVSDKVVSCTRPILYRDHGTEIDLTWQNQIFTFDVTERSLGFYVPKQRWGPSGRTFMLDLETSQGVLTDAAPSSVSEGGIAF